MESELTIPPALQLVLPALIQDHPNSAPSLHKSAEPSVQDGIQRAIATNASGPERLWFSPQACSGCGQCLVTCPKRALSRAPGAIRINHFACNLCLECIEICPRAALGLSDRI